MRRNKGPVAAATIVALALLGGIVGTSWGMVRAREAQAEADTQRSEAERQRDTAVSARHRTREALDLMTSHEAESAMARQREIAPEQRQFLEQVLPYYREFANEPGEDRQGRERLAAAHLRLAGLLHRLGKTADGADVAQRGVALLDDLVRDFPNEPQYRIDLALMLTTAGVLFVDVDRRSEAAAAHRRSVALREELLATSPEDAALRSGLAQSLTNQGRLLTVLGELDQADAALRRAIALRERNLALKPGDQETQSSLASTFLNWGNLLFQMERYTDAEAACRRVVELTEPLVASMPNDAVRTDRAFFSDDPMVSLITVRQFGEVLAQRSRCWFGPIYRRN